MVWLKGAEHITKQSRRDRGGGPQGGRARRGLGENEGERGARVSRRRDTVRTSPIWAKWRQKRRLTENCCEHRCVANAIMQQPAIAKESSELGWNSEKSMDYSDS